MFFLMLMRKSKANQTVEGMCIFLSNIAKGAAFVHQGVRNCFVAFLSRCIVVVYL